MEVQMKKIRMWLLRKLVKQLFDFESFVIVEAEAVEEYKKQTTELVVRLAMAEAKLHQYQLTDEFNDDGTDRGPADGGLLQ
jgi:hypothetical protein